MTSAVLVAATSAAPWVFGNECSRHKGINIPVGDAPLPWKKVAEIAELNWPVELRNPGSQDVDAIPADEWKQVVKVTIDPTTQMKKYRTLGMVGLRYTPLLNEKAFGWFDKVTFEGAAIIRAAGHRDHGKQVWMIAERPQAVELYPGCYVREKLIVETSHNGSTAVKIRFEPHVDATGVPVAFELSKKFRSEVRIRHTKSMDLKMETIDKILDKENVFFEAWRTAIIGDQGKPGLRQRVVTEAEVVAIAKALFPDTKKRVEQPDGTTKVVEEVSGRAEKARDLILGRVREQFETTKNAFEKAGQEVPQSMTALDAFLGVATYIAKDRKTRKEGNQWVASTFGSGAKMRQKAFDLISGL